MGCPFDVLYQRDAIDAVLATLAPPELIEVRAVGANGFVTAAVLTRLAARLAAAAPSSGDLRLIDLGCGAGGVGLWLASHLPAILRGIDASAIGVAQARQRAARAGIDAQFSVARFADTGLDSAGAEAVVSSDALYLARDPGAAVREVARLLVPGGVLAFNTYPPAGADDPWLEVLGACGFEVIDVDDRSAEWRDVMARKHRARLDHAAWLTDELKAKADPELAVSRAMLGVGRPSFLAATRRVELAARRAR